MTRIPIVTDSDYKRVKEATRTMFQNDRSGDQSLYREQEKLFKPITNVEKKTSKSLQKFSIYES